MGIASQIYEGGGAKPCSFPQRGSTYEGKITQIRERQLTRFGTEIPEVWDDGSPKMTPIITLQTELQEDAEDNGLRDLYLRGGVFTAFGSALREAYTTPPDDGALVGATLKIQHHDTAPSKFGNPRKLYRIRITPKPGGAVASAWADNERPTQAPPQSAYPDEDIPF